MIMTINLIIILMMIMTINLIMILMMIMIPNSDGRLVDLVCDRLPSLKTESFSLFDKRSMGATSQLHGGREGPRQAEDGNHLGGRRPRHRALARGAGPGPGQGL